MNKFDIQWLYRVHPHMCKIHCAMDRYTIMAGGKKTNFADSSFPNLYKLQSVCDCAWHHPRHSQILRDLIYFIIPPIVFLRVHWHGQAIMLRTRCGKIATQEIWQVVKLIHRQITLIHVLSQGIHNSDTLHTLKYIQTMLKLTWGL